MLITVFESLMLMISFGTFVATILSEIKK
ncbi:putative holin-like toxin [Virgibacillus sp. MSP4-1]